MYFLLTLYIGIKTLRTRTRSSIKKKIRERKLLCTYRTILRSYLIGKI